MSGLQPIQLSDTEALGTAAQQGLGLCQLTGHITHADLACGKLVEVLPSLVRGECLQKPPRQR